MRLPVLVLHICAGLVGLLSGAAAMSFRKGSHRHRVAGNVFVLSILGMGAAGSCLALMKHQINNVFGGVFTGYLVATAWATGRRRDGEASMFEWGALLVGLVIGVVMMTYGFEVANRPTPPKDGIPVGMYFFMGSVALLSAAGDARMVLRGGLSGTQRLVRHLWRMCFALFNATGSFFLGQQQVFPAAIRSTNLLFVPAIFPLVLLIFWLFRVRLTGAYKHSVIGRMPA